MHRHLAVFLLLLTLAAPALTHAQSVTPATPDPLTASSASLTQEQRAAVIAQLRELIVQLTQQLQAIIVARAGGAASAPATCNLTRTLGRGSRGDDVTCLQRFLIAHQYLASGNDSGYFGPLTEQAVQRFQIARSIVSSGTPQSTGFGLVGRLTRAAIAAERARSNDTGGGRTGTVTPSPSAPLGGTGIGYGDGGSGGPHDGGSGGGSGGTGRGSGGEASSSPCVIGTSVYGSCGL